MRNVAVIFDLDKNWIGGSYYIRNLVSALALLPAAEQPRLILISAKAESVRFIAETGYPHIGWITTGQFYERPSAFPFDAIFPHPVAGQEARTVSWIPDFQELHLPYFFSEQEVRNRRNHHRQRFNTAGLVVSSADVKADVERFYPGECARIAVVRFATFDRFDDSRVAEVVRAYGITGRYVLCANQVWVHKNHIVVLKAVELLKRQGIHVQVFFTGNENDYRVPGYTDFLKRLVVEWELSDRVRFLGFIPREDQLCLMKGAHYIVQPSLFEGWSTVIEDAKAMGQFVVASDLGVHKEQLSERCRFFGRHDPQELAAIMRDLAANPAHVAATLDYDEARRSFARDFLAALDDFLPMTEPPQDNLPVTRHDLVLASEANMVEVRALPSEPEQPTAKQPIVPSAAVAFSPFIGAGVRLAYLPGRDQAQVSLRMQLSQGSVIGMLLMMNGSSSSLEFNVDLLEPHGRFAQDFIEVGRKRVYRIYLDHPESDIQRRFNGLPPFVQNMLRSLTQHDLIAIPVAEDDGSGRAARIVDHCMDRLTGLLCG